MEELTNPRLLMFDLACVPMGKPRMTQKDRYEPSPAVQRYWAWKKDIQYQIKKDLYGPAFTEPLTGPLKTTCFFRMPIPTSWSRKKRIEAQQRLILHTSKPDYDNLVKGIYDALSGLVYVDDAQVCGVGEGYKYYCEEPGASIIVETIEPPLILPWDHEAAM